MNPIEGLRDRIRQTAHEKQFSLPVDFDQLSNEKLVLIGHEMTYPGEANDRPARA